MVHPPVTPYHGGIAPMAQPMVPCDVLRTEDTPDADNQYVCRSAMRADGQDLWYIDVDVRPAVAC